ncbi:hypothetical protein [Tabrizicola soli]|uniref:Uncharacterized protein n=1 Tax=Tabrizicola soli TaxID=2185115 RepID=A0ABV7DUK6_9RHOB|nr:hypothetical protein [Tabrizicola soli]
MKKLLATTALALVALSGAASAQSVLERVLDQIDGSSNMETVNGVFANIAENIGTVGETGEMLTAIDGSITNLLSGFDGPTADVNNAVTAVEQVTVDLGDMATTVLGAVNTGDITLGVNQDVSEAIAGTSSAVSNAIDQLGGSADTSAIVLNVASNATDIIGSVNTTFDGLNGSLGNVATTVLGAVNTGTITSGVNSAVEGIQSGIVGTN